MQSDSGASSSYHEEEFKQCLSDLAARVKTIKDDILDEELNVETQLIRVSTSAVSWNQNFFLRSGRKTFIQEIRSLEVWRNKKKQLSFEECIRFQDAAVSWRELPDVWEIKAGDVIRDVARGMPVAKLTARPVEHYRFLYFAIALSDGTEQKYEADKRKIEQVLNVPIGVSSAIWNSVDDVDDVCKGVMETSDPVLIVAGPGTGKTWFLQQLCCKLGKAMQSNGGASLLPILIDSCAKAGSNSEAASQHERYGTATRVSGNGLLPIFFSGLVDDCCGRSAVWRGMLVVSSIRRRL
jgi:hypothetical protein